MFVADPQRAPRSDGILYSRPDDISDDGLNTWRQRLQSYNEKPGDNASALSPAWSLYAPKEYRKLVDKFGTTRVFILSAGWGLIRSGFLTPYYDITLSRPPQKDQLYKWRRAGDPFIDFCQLSADEALPIIFLGGAAYRPLFESLTKDHSAQKTIYHRSANIEPCVGFDYKRYRSRRSTNWHYDCANDLIAGRELP